MFESEPVLERVGPLRVPAVGERIASSNDGKKGHGKKGT
jgi:hypothetical protein